MRSCQILAKLRLPPSFLAPFGPVRTLRPLFPRVCKVYWWRRKGRWVIRSGWRGAMWERGRRWMEEERRRRTQWSWAGTTQSTCRGRHLHQELERTHSVHTEGEWQQQPSDVGGSGEAGGEADGTWWWGRQRWGGRGGGPEGDHTHPGLPPHSGNVTPPSYTPGIPETGSPAPEFGDPRNLRAERNYSWVGT